ncbi:MAG: MucB/RseB C-terminal domain-containing protein [Gammaproteobacteria bacterium]
MTRIGLALLSLTLFSANATFAADPQQLLARMGQAAQQLDFDATLVYRIGERMFPMRLEHRVAAQGQQERLVRLDGALRMVQRNGEAVTCSLSGADAEYRSQALQKTLFERLGQGAVMDTYRLRYLGAERVSDRLAHVVALDPSDSDRYGLRLWLDQESGLYLRAAWMDVAGERLEEVQLTDLTVFGELPTIGDSPVVRSEMQHAVSSDALPAWLPQWLPDGFEVLQVHAMDLPSASGLQGQVWHILAGDGIASLSIVVEPAGDDPIEGRFALGALHMHSDVMEGAHQRVLMGELPPATLERIAESMRPISTATPLAQSPS